MQLSPIIRNLLIELKRLTQDKLDDKIHNFNKPCVKQKCEQPPVPDFLFDAEKHPLHNAKISVEVLKSVDEYDEQDYCKLFESIFSFKYCENDADLLNSIKKLYEESSCFKSLLNYLIEKTEGETHYMYVMFKMLIRC